MLSRRENLLIAPWQRRRYLDHRRKVSSALPAIDVRCPVPRDHVMLKRKKIQKEFERCKKIEHDNFILMKHLNRIMTTSRVDNVWETPPPDFLHRIAIFPVKRVQTPPPSSSSSTPPKTRKERCVGCTPKHVQHELQMLVPEARVPYDPPKPRLSRRRSSVLAKEEMKKEIDRLYKMDQYRKRQNSEHQLSQRSLSCSSQRTSSYEQSPRRQTRKETAPKNQRVALLTDNQKGASIDFLNSMPNYQKSKSKDTRFPSCTIRRTKNSSAGHTRAESGREVTRLPAAKTIPSHSSGLSDLTLSTVQTYETRGSKKNKKSSKLCARRSNLRQIELKDNALELVLEFPARSKVTTTTIH